MAKSYNSILSIQSENLKWKTSIKMNNPLRIKGYTIYQTSFIENDNLKATVLTIVKNYATYVFYISSFLVILGLIIHTFKIFLKIKNE
jgi:cytochrome c biogenesis protein ResB